MIEDDEVEKVIIELEEILCGEGLYLHAYKMKSGRFRQITTFAVHDKVDKPRSSRDCLGPLVVLNGRPGKTKECEAYKKLSSLLNLVKY
ncbi:MAG: hypothetical protein ABW148_18710 [Sedimenticola sp.]